MCKPNVFIGVTMALAFAYAAYIVVTTPFGL